MVKKSDADKEIVDQLRRGYYQRLAIHLRCLQDMPGDEEIEVRGSPRWDGGEDSRGVSHRPVWPKLAKTAAADGLQPYVWLDTLFAMSYCFAHVPRPPDLLDSKVLHRAKNWKQHTGLDLFHRTRTELQNAIVSHWQRKEYGSQDDTAIARSIVVDPRLELSALSRYAVAVSYAQNDLAAALAPAAAVQYRVEPKMYAGVLNLFFPAHLIAVRLDELVKAIEVGGDADEER